jgi:hypothetical protein
MGGFGTVALEGLFGAIGGAGQAAASQALLEQKDQMDALREQRLSALRTKEYAANLQANVASAPAMIAAQTPGIIDRLTQEQKIKDASEAAKPRVMAPGSTLVTPGTPGTPGVTPTDAAESGGTLDEGAGATPGTPDKTFTAPTKLSPGQEAYYQAHADEAKALTARYQAEADAINRGERYNSQNQKPKVTLLDKDQGLLKDENTGAIGYVIPGKPAKAGVSHVFGADEPAQPATMPTTVWFDPGSGKALANGLDDLYPKKKAAKAAASAAPASTPAPSDNSTDTAESAGAPPTSASAPPAAPAASPATSDKPPAAYPDARKAADGKWYVKRGNAYFRVMQ